MFYLHESTLWKIHKSFARLFTARMASPAYVIWDKIQTAMCDGYEKFPSNRCQVKVQVQCQQGLRITLFSFLQIKTRRFEDKAKARLKHFIQQESRKTSGGCFCYCGGYGVPLSQQVGAGKPHLYHMESLLCQCTCVCHRNRSYPAIFSSEVIKDGLMFSSKLLNSRRTLPAAEVCLLPKLHARQTRP